MKIRGILQKKGFKIIDPNTEGKLREMIREVLKEARLKDIVPDIIFTAAQYTNKKLDHIARQSWDSSEELTKQIMQSIPIHKWTSFRKDVDKLLKQYSIREVSPPGWEGTVKAMKKHKDIDNPWALSWHMKNKGYKSHKESVNEASKPKAGDYVKTVYGIGQINKVRGTIAYIKLPNDTKGFWPADARDLKPTSKKEKGKTLWTESDLGLTYKKGKTITVTHKTSGKEIVIIDKPNVRKEYEKIGYLVKEAYSSKNEVISTSKDIKTLKGKKVPKGKYEVINARGKFATLMRIYDKVDGGTIYNMVPIDDLSKVAKKLKESVNEAVGKAELTKMIKMAKQAGARKYDIIKSLASDLSKSEDEIVSSLEKYNLIRMTEVKINKARKKDR